MRNLSNSENEFTYGRNLANSNGDILSYTLSATLPVVYTENTDEASIISLKGITGLGTANQILKMNSGATALEWIADNNTEYTATLPLSISPSNVISTAFTADSTTTMSNKTIGDELHGNINPTEQYIQFNTTYGFDIYAYYLSASSRSYNMSFKNNTHGSTFPYIAVSNAGDMILHQNGVGDAMIIKTDRDININVGDIIGDSTSNYTKTRMKDIYCRYVYGEALVAKNGSTSSGYILMYEDGDNGSNYLKLQAPASLASDAIDIVLPSVAGTIALDGDIPTDAEIRALFSGTPPIQYSSGVISTTFTTTSSDILSNKTIYNPILTGASGAYPKFQIKDESLTHTINVFTQEIGADINVSFPASTGSIALVDDIPTTAEIRALLSADTPLVYDNSTGNFTTTFTPSSTSTLTNKSGSNNMWTNDAGYRTQANVVQDIGEATNVANTTIIGSTPTRYFGNGHCDCTIKGALTTIESDNLVIDSKIKGVLKLTNGATSAGAIQIFEDEDSGLNAITIQPHAQTYADFTITLPSSAGQLALVSSLPDLDNTISYSSTAPSLISFGNATTLRDITMNTSGFLITSGDKDTDCVLTIKSDTDNNDETSNPILKFMQDGDIVTAVIQLGNDDMYIQHQYTGDVNTKLRLGAYNEEQLHLYHDTADVFGTLNVLPTNTTSFYIMKLLAASLADGNGVEMVLGKANSSKNCGTIAFYHSSDGADANYMILGMKSQETQIKLLGDGKIEFNTTQITHDAGTSLAMNYISSDGASAVSILSAGVDSGVKQVATLILRAVGATTSSATIEFNGSSERLTIENLDGETWVGGNDATQIKCKTDEVNCSCNKFYCADLRLGVQEVSAYTYHFNPSGTNGAATTAGMFLAYHDNGSVLYFGTPYSAAVVGNKDFYYGNVIKQRMMASGTCYSTGLWTDSHSFSDDRLKEEETELTNCMETINKLKPQIYKKFSLSSLGEENPLKPNIYIPFTERLSDEYKWETGFIAQEIYTIPELRHIVELPPDSDIDKVLNTKIYDGLDEPKGFYEKQGWGDKQPASIDSPQIIPYLVGALQDMDKTIKQQQIIINKLISSKSFKEFKSL